MRRGIWMLAVYGVAAISAETRAAEPFPEMTPRGAAPSAGRVPEVPVRYTRPATGNPTAGAPATAPKNYYDELFAEEAAAAEKAAVDKASDKPAGVSRPKSVSPVAKVITDKTAPAVPSRNGGSTPRFSLDVAPAEGSKVQQAGFQKTPTDQSFIQPVRHTELAPAVGRPTRVVPVVTDAAPQLPSVSVEWVRRSDINVGQECAVELVVKNTGTVPATKVAVDAKFPTTVRLTSAEPKPTSVTDQLTWTFDTIAPGTEQKIGIKLIPSRRGELATTASVRLTGQANANFRVEEPLLKVAVKGQSDVMVGDSAAQSVVVSNPGTGVVHDVKIEATLSAGLESPKGAKFTLDVGSISPGESQTIRLPVSAVKGGPQTIEILATSSSADASSAESVKLNVLAPALKLAMEGPGLRYKGRDAKYVMTVKNDGTVANNNVRVVQNVADGFKFLSADKGGKFDANRQCVTWFVGRLEPNQSVQVSCELATQTLGDYKLVAQASSDAGSQVTATTETTIDGTPALSLKLVDLDDPVEVGSETAYEIRVVNEGTKAAANVNIVCELPAGLDLLNAKGPTEAISDGQLISFKPLAQLAPGTQALFRVHVKGTVEGDLRFRAKVTSDSIEQPMLVEEQTKFYSDVRK